VSESFVEKLQDFRKLFIAAFDNPIARRRYDDEYANACREAFNDLMRMADTPPLSILLNTQGNSDIVKEAMGGLAGLLMPNANWYENAKAVGVLATSPEEVARLGGVVSDPMNRMIVQEPKQGHHDVGDSDVSSDTGN
jgi:hypothetical protein